MGISQDSLFSISADLRKVFQQKSIQQQNKIGPKQKTQKLKWFGYPDKK